MDKKEDQVTSLQAELKTAADSYTKTYIETVKEVVSSQKDTTNAVNLMQRSLDALSNGFQTLINGKGRT